MSTDGGLAASSQRARKRPWASTAVVLALVVGIGVVGGLTIHHRNNSSTSRNSFHSAAQTFPRRWDPRVLPLVKIVEKDRGLKFRHPVSVEFLSSNEFAQRYNTMGNNLSAARRSELLRSQNTLRALELTSDSEDLIKDAGTSSGADVIGLYSYMTKQIWVRDTRLTAAVKATLVHELTHALDDQYFNLGATFSRLDAADGPGSFAYDALVEGDAVRIEVTYTSTLSNATRKLIARQQQAELQTTRPPGHGPWFLATVAESAYPLGEIAVSRIANKGGNRAVNKLFERPPTQQIELLEPWLLDAHWNTKPVRTPALKAGETKVDSGEFGALNLYLLLLLSENSSPVRPLAAADAWGGDHYVTYTEGGTACIDLAITGRTPADTRTLQSIVTKWAQASGFATAVSNRTTVTVSSCSSGASYAVYPAAVEAAVELVTVRNKIEADLEKDHNNKAFSVCYAQALPGQFGITLLSDHPTNAQRNKMRQIALSCIR